MSRFRFRLDSLLRLREHQEGAARQDLADSQRKALQARDELEALTVERSAATRRVTAAGQAGSLVALRIGHAHIHRLSQLEAASRQRLEQLDAECQERRETAIAAHRARQIIANLKERQRLCHLREAGRSEAMQMDETGAQQAARRALSRRAGGVEE